MMNNHGNNYYNNLTPVQKEVLKGVVLSIMEARYRNKNVQGKSNLKIKAAEGELCPFLVYLENLNAIKRTGNGPYIYIDDNAHTTFYKFPTFDELITGAYLWMHYYDSDVINSTTHSTLTSKLSDGSEGEDIEVDWESEYYTLLENKALPTLTGKELEKFYNKCHLTKSIFKKSSENAGGIFGAEELYDITSDINFSEAIENMSSSMIAFAASAGGELRDVFSGLTSDHIARTYIMAKNIVESNRVTDEYAYYDIGSNIISYTPGKSSDEFILCDFQKIKLKSPLKVDNKDTYEDSDGDGLYDRIELGNDYGTSLSGDENSMKKKVDVTGFIKKMVERELYGNDEKQINDNQNYVNEVVAKVKYNIYNDRNHFDAVNNENNKLNWKEVYENNLNVDDATRANLGVIADDTAKIQYLKLSPAKLEVELWKYRSNPVLKDTDFDGIDDGLGTIKLKEIERQYGLTNENEDDLTERFIHCKLIPRATLETLRKDKIPKDNHFTGRMNSTRLSGTSGIEVDMNMDYRYFFLSNKLYYDELSTMSLLYANSIYRQGRGISIYDDNNPSHGNLKVKDMMEFYGFKNVKTYYMGTEEDDGYETGDICRKYHRKDTHKGRVALGYKNIEYHGLYKIVIGIVIRGTAEDDDWDSDFDMGDINLKRALNTKTAVLSGKENNTIGNMVIDGSTKNSRIIDLYFNHNSVLTYGKDNIPLGYSKEYFEELKHFAYGYPDWTHSAHHAGFDIVANRMLEIINEYYREVENHFDDDVEESDDNNQVNNVVAHTNELNRDKVCFWVTGHSMGAGVANTLEAESLHFWNDV